MPQTTRVPLPTPERDAAAARLALPVLAVAPTPGDADALMAVSRVYGASLALSADPVAADAAERRAASETLDEVAIPFLLVSLPDDWEHVGGDARPSLATLTAASLNAQRQREAGGQALDGATLLAGQRSAEAICMGCVVGAVYVAPDGGGDEEVEHFRLHRGPPGGGNRPIAMLDGATQNAVVAEVQKHLASFRLPPKRIRRL